MFAFRFMLLCFSLVLFSDDRLQLFSFPIFAFWQTATSRSLYHPQVSWFSKFKPPTARWQFNKSFRRFVLFEVTLAFSDQGPKYSKIQFFNRCSQNPHNRRGFDSFRGKDVSKIVHTQPWPRPAIVRDSKIRYATASRTWWLIKDWD